MPGFHLYKFFQTHSRIFIFLDKKLQQLKFRINGRRYHAPYKNDAEKMEYERLTREAEETTLVILKEIAKIVPKKTKLFSFHSLTSEQQSWKQVVEEAGFTAWPNIISNLEEARRNGVVVKTYDQYHWTPKGHEMVGEQIIHELKKVIQ